MDPKLVHECDHDDREERPKKRRKLIEDYFIPASNRFSRHLLSNRSFDQKHCSPISAFMNICTLYLGYDEDTRKKMRVVLGLSKDADRLLLFNIKSANHILTQSGTLEITNRLWTADNIKLKEELQEMVESFASIQLVDFTTDDTYWMIKDHINIQNGAYDKDITLLLTNSIQFQSRWKTPFDKHDTCEKPFYSNGFSREIEMISKRDWSNWMRNDDFQLLEMDYLDVDFVFGIVLPNNEILKEPIYSTEYLKMCIDQMTNAYTNLTIPKFSCQSTIELSNSFCIGNNKMYQQINFNIDENGTNVVEDFDNIDDRIYLTSKMIEFTANHPFYYYIRHCPTNTFVYCGVFTSY